MKAVFIDYSNNQKCIEYGFNKLNGIKIVSSNIINMCLTFDQADELFQKLLDDELLCEEERKWYDSCHEKIAHPNPLIDEMLKEHGKFIKEIIWNPYSQTLGVIATSIRGATLIKMRWQ